MSPSAWPVCRYAPCPGWFRPRRRWRVWRQPRGRPWRGAAEAAGHNPLGLRCRMRRSCSWLNWDSSVLLSRHCHTLLINLPLSQRTSHCCSEKTFVMFQTFVSVCTMRGECLLETGKLRVSGLQRRRDDTEQESVPTAGPTLACRLSLGRGKSRKWSRDRSYNMYFQHFRETQHI